MKTSSETATTTTPHAEDSEIVFPLGLVGFRDFGRAQVVYREEQLPFLWLTSQEGPDISFLVLEPTGIVPDYAIELEEQDVEFLQLEDPAEALVLNIVSVPGGHFKDATVNLVGPVVINRSTRRGKQVIIANHQNFSARHPLRELQQGEGGSSC